MSSEAQTVIEELSRLPRLDQLAVYEAIARKVTPTRILIIIIFLPVSTDIQ